MKTILFLSSVILVAILSIQAVSEPDQLIVFGNYGGDGETGPAIVLNPDYTFHYVDNTSPAHLIDITGKWEIVNQQVHLMDVTDKKVMTELEIVREGCCLKARKGMAFYTLCRSEE